MVVQLPTMRIETVTTVLRFQLKKPVAKLALSKLLMAKKVPQQS